MMLSLDTAYRSFGGEVEASSTPTICRLSDSRRHQLSAIAQSSEGIKFSAVELAAAAKPLPDLDSIPKSLAATPANKVSDVRRSTRGEADILTLTMANTTTTLYMHCI